MFKVHFVYEHLPEGLERATLMDKLRIVCSAVLYSMADLAVRDRERFYVGVTSLPGVSGFLCVIGGPRYDAFDFLEYDSDDADKDRVYSHQDILEDLKSEFGRQCFRSELWARYLDWIKDHINVEPVCNKYTYTY